MSSDLFDPAVLYILLSICTLSIIGTLIPLISLIRKCKCTHRNEKMVYTIYIFCIIATDLLDSISELSGLLYFMSTNNPTNMSLCVAQAFGTQFASISSVLYTTAVAFIMCRIATGKPLSIINAISLNVAIFLFSFILSIIPWVFDTYAPANIHCWIDDSQLGLIFRLTFFYGPLWVFCIPCTVICYCKLCCKMKEMKKKDKLRIMQLILFPIVTIICYLPVTVTRTIDYMNRWWRPVENPIELRITAYACLLSVGLLDSLIFFFYDRIVELLCNICSRGQSSEDKPDNMPQKDSENGAHETTTTGQTKILCTSTVWEFPHLESSQMVPINPIPPSKCEYSPGIRKIEHSRVSKSKSKSK
eukprot:31016_1